VAAGVRHGLDPASGVAVTPAGRRPRRARALAVGVALAVAYVGGAALTAHLDALGGRALLDGGFVAPYNWVSPPPALASANTPPSSADESIPVSPEGGSQAMGVTTDDLQVTLLLSKGAFPTKEGQEAVRVRITPMAPTEVGPLPRGEGPQGNAYRIQATYQPGGDAAGRVQPQAQLVMVYPAPPNPGTFEGTIFVSPDGENWSALNTRVSSARHQALTETDRLGYFVVGSLPQPTPSGPAPAGGASQALRIALIALLVAGAGAAAWLISGRWLQRRAAREQDEWRGGEGRR
jgi:hypothetical protein